MTDVLTAKERGDMAEAMLPTAAHLVTLVHGDGGPSDVQDVLGKLSPLQKDALLVVLAGLVNPDQPMSAALGWLDFDETGRTVVPPWGEQTRVRDLAPGPVLDEDDNEHVDEVAVRKYAEGVRVMVTPRERLEAVRLCVARGMNYPDIDAMQGLTRGSTSTFISRTRRAYALRGEEFPELVRPHGPRGLTNEQAREIRETYALGGVTDLELAMRFGVTRNVVTHVLTGDTYTDAGGPIRPKRTQNKPGTATRKIWAVSPHFARAS
ncbi:hypothetical protein [Streptomyces roseoviridis]|uniref:Uncharacterized protein n=1 Tax=Streptomyces roseoviridis TaxID=67361 RepID=A0ABV5QYT5_9ACTN